MMMNRAMSAIVFAFSLAARTVAFAPTHRNRDASPHRVGTSLNANTERINVSIDLDSPKVATMEKLSEGGKKVYCRCWQSGTFPLCDGAHVAHNKETGDNVGPLIVSAAKQKSNDVVVAEVSKEEAAAPAAATTTTEGDGKTSILGKLKAMFKREEDGLTTKERLAKMGLSALLSYGFVSNMSYAVMLSLSWYGFAKKTGLSPLAPGQWKPFLAVYAGFYVFNNIVRPIRFAASVGVARYFDNFVGFVERKTKLSRKLSIGVVVFLANVCGTFAAMGLGVAIASTAAGVPIFPAKIV